MRRFEVDVVGDPTGVSGGVATVVRVGAIGEPVLEAAIRRMILLSQRSECPLYVVHVSSTWGVEAIREAKMRRLPVTGEVLHNYLAFTSENYAADEGLLYHNYPPLKSRADQATLAQFVQLKSATR